MGAGRSWKWNLGALTAAFAVLLLWGATAAQAASVSVETTLDDGNEPAGACTLREAILASGGAGTADCTAVGAGLIDTIDFDGLTGPGPHVINAENGYILTKTVTIDASGAAGEVRVDGAGASGPQMNFGFQTRADGIVIKGLSITNWAQNGVKIDLENGSSAADGVQIIDNFIGTNQAGQPGLGNFSTGVAIGQDNGNAQYEPDDTVIEGNVISDNGVGIKVAGPGTQGTVIEGNLIGTTPGGNAALGNQNAGVIVGDNAVDVTIGGSGPGEGNVISDNGGQGVLLTAPAGDFTSDVTVEGNTIGLGSGGATLGNDDGGVAIVGDVDGAEIRGNTISANGIAGISLTDAVAEGPDATEIEGNRIGTNPSGTAVRANDGPAVSIGGNDAGPIDTRIGGAVTPGGACVDPCNVIAGTGISIGHTAGNTSAVLGNHIGVNAAGTGALAVSGSGVTVTDADDVVIGSPIAPNTIGTTAIAAVQMQAGVSGGTIQSNLIGTRSDGTGDLPNTNHGIDLQGASGVLVGGTAAGEGNLIANNGADGVRVSDDGDDNAIVGNRIYDNGLSAIDLEDSGGFGPTPNDADDSDTGANDLQNFIDLGLVTRSNSIRLVGDLNSTPNTFFRVEVFTNPTPHPSGLGEGEQLVASFEVEVDGSGTESVEEVLNGALPSGSTMSLTVTELTASGGDPVQTSEFSPSVAHGHCAETPTSTGLGIIFGTAGEDELTGTAADEILCGLANNDILDGGPGDDLIVGGEGAGFDEVRFAGAPGAVSVDLAAGTAAGLGDDDLVGIERAIGTAFADTLLGDAGVNELFGGDGPDLINPRGGLDRAFGGAGDDLIVVADGAADNQVQCGAGTDTLIADVASLDLESRIFECEIIDRPGPPQLALSGEKKQKSKSKVVVEASCANEACELAATGKIKIKVLKKKSKKGKKGKGSRLSRTQAAKSKTLKLKPATASAAAGETVKLKLKLPKKAKKLIKKVIRKKKSKATVEVVATDGVGNPAAAEKLKVKVKKGKKKGK